MVESGKNALAARAFASQNTCEVPMRRFSNQNRKVAWRDALFLSTRTMETWLGDWPTGKVWQYQGWGGKSVLTAKSGVVRVGWDCQEWQKTVSGTSPSGSTMWKIFLRSKTQDEAIGLREGGVG